MKTIKIFTIDHAVEIIFFDNLDAKFDEFLGIKDGETIAEAIERNKFTLHDIVEFLNKYAYNEKYEIA